MVKIREGLPLIDGQTTETDSASLTAQLAHERQAHARYQKTHSKAKQKQQAPINQPTINNNQPSQKADWQANFNKKFNTRKLNATLNNANGDNSNGDSSSIDNAHLYDVNADNRHNANNTDSVNNANTLVDNTVADKTKELTKNLSDERPLSPDIHQSNIDIEAWLVKVAERIGEEKLDKLAKAIDYIQQLDVDYKGKRSNTFATGIGMTDILTYIYQDEDALVSAMLYRSARHRLISIEEIEENFGKDVASLISDTLAMGRLTETIEKNQRFEEHLTNNHREKLNNIYSMLISVTNDVRVVMIKLAERTFAMRELSFSSEERQKRVAREVMTIYAPLAHRLGIAQIKWELEDLSFRYLAPERYKEIAKLLAEKRSEREDYIERVQNLLKQTLIEHNIDGDVSGRVKHIYSIYRKMKLKNLSFDQLYDIRALRVLVNTQAECYHVLGLVHGLWRHIPEQFDDYITNPKANGYRSLHTAVIAENKSLEVQIRTHNMHFEAELGVCAHVNYKEGGKADNYLNQRINSLRQLLLRNSEKNNPKNDDEESDNNANIGNENPDLNKESSDKKINQPNSQSTADINTNAETDKPTTTPPRTNTPNKVDELDEEEQLVDFEEFERIYVFTRDGDIMELPKGSTVLDCAYYIHTQVGNRAQGGRVNQRYVPLTYQLKTGEQVEIITKSSREPNRDWLVPTLGYITTSRARSKLRQWFNRLDRDKNIEIGRELLHKELERLAVHPNSIDLNKYKQHFNVKQADDILVGLVTGEIGIHQLTNQISKELNLEPEKDLSEIKPSIHPKATGKLDAYKICVDGLDNIEINLAKCCTPVRGEPISGFITQSKGVSIHHRGCAEYARLIEKEPERQIDATWYTDSGRSQPVAIFIEAYDRRGLLRDLTQVIDNEDINIRKVETLSTDDDIAKMKLHIEVIGLAQLSKLLAKLEQQVGILVAKRAVG